MAPNLFAGASEIVVSGGTFNAVAGNQDNTTINTYVTLPDDAEKFLASLKPADRGGYFVSPCMEGTRQSVFDNINRWLKDIHEPNILWLNGSPGCAIYEHMREQAYMTMQVWEINHCV